MATIKLIEESDATGEVARVYEDIRRAFGSNAVPNLFKAMGHHPDYLASTWARIKAVMGPGRLERRTKEIIALAVSATNGCVYCVHAHTAALRRLGLGDAEIAETMAVVDLFNGLNKFAEGLQIEPDLK
jgi:AhpD family alkylhydroperoxidase